MAKQVTRSGKDRDGDITALCGSFGRASKAQAIADIRQDPKAYYVQVSGVGAVDIRVVNGASGPYLRTDPDKTSRNNLDDLPDC